MAQRLAQHLIARGLLPARTVDVALKRMAAQGGALDTSLLEAGVISEVGMLQAVSDVSGVRLVNLADFEPNTEAAPLMPYKMAKQLNVVPLSLDGNSLHVASAYPIPASQLRDLGFLLGRKLELWVALECRVKDWQAVLYKQRLDNRFGKLLAQLDPTRSAPTEEQRVMSAPEPDEKTAPIALSKPAPAVGATLSSSPTSKTDSISPDVVARMAQGIVEEPLLLDKPKVRKTTPSPVPAPRSAPRTVPPPAPAASPPTPVLGEEFEEIRTSVLEPVAYERFAKAEHGASKVPLEDPDEHDNTRVLDLKGYSNFAREVTPEAGSARPSTPPAPKISFPGGVLPPRRSGGDSPVPKPAVATGLVQPASPGRLPPVAGRDKKVEVVVPVAAPPPAIDPELDFSEVNEVLKSAPPRVVVPPEPPASLGGRSEAPKPAEPPVDKSKTVPPPVAPVATPVPVASRPVPARPAAAVPPRQPAAPSRPAEASGSRTPVASPTSAPAPMASLAEPLPPPAVTPVVPIVAPAAAAPPPAPASSPRAEQILPAPPGLAGSNALEWSLAQARASLKGATHEREHLISVILEYGRRTFEYIAAFAVMRGAAVGWDARGDVDVEALRQVAIPLDAASVFRTVSLTRGSYVGPLPPDALSQHYLALLARSPRTVFVWPIEVQSRLVAILYGDCGARPVSQRRLSDFILFCQDLPNAFHELIVYRKQNPRAERGLTEPAGSMAAWHESLSPPPGADEHHSAADGEWFNGLISLLTGPDPSERSMAMLELMKTPDASARALTYAFPGPTGWSRLPVVELPEPDELGPIPGALARLAQAGATALAPLLDSSDSDTRYLALLTAGNLRYPDVVGGVLRGLFDFEPDISSAARAAASSLKALPHFQHRLPELRHELRSSDGLRRSLAARALGVLHDRESIDALINLTGSEDDLCAQSAAEALKEVTRAAYGTNPTAWTQWWARARDKRRIEWLVEALSSDDFDSRLAAVEELSRAFGDNLGYFADGSEAERAQALGRWHAVVTERPDVEI